MLVFLAAMYLLIQWVTTSFVITGNGAIKWGEGLERTLCYWRPGCEWDINDGPVLTSGD